jgi:hypothetical protein
LRTALRALISTLQNCTMSTLSKVRPIGYLVVGARIFWRFPTCPTLYILAICDCFFGHIRKRLGFLEDTTLPSLRSGSGTSFKFGHWSSRLRQKLHNSFGMDLPHLRDQTMPPPGTTTRNSQYSTATKHSRSLLNPSHTGSQKQLEQLKSKQLRHISRPSEVTMLTKALPLPSSTTLESLAFSKALNEYLATLRFENEAKLPETYSSQ